MRGRAATAAVVPAPDGQASGGPARGASARGRPACALPASGAVLLAGAAPAVEPIQAVYTFGFAPGSAELQEEHAPVIALAIGGAERLDRLGERAVRPGPVRFQIAGFAPHDAALAAKRAAALRDALLRAGVGPERVVSLDPTRAPESASDTPPWGPDRAELVVCPAAERGCVPR